MQELLKDLVHIYSVSGHEAEITDYITNILSELKNVEVFSIGTSSVAVQVPGKVRNKALIIGGHTDTVPPGDVKMWRGNPFEVWIENEKAYGLGTSDMKSGIAVMIELLKDYDKARPACDLWFVFAAGEEVDGVGMRELTSFFEKNHQKEYTEINAIMLEPTGLEYLGVGHRGNIMYEINVHGQSGHGSRPYEVKKHAIYDALEIVARIKKAGETWKTKYADEVLGEPDITITSINTENMDSPNKFPAVCKLGVDVRTTPTLHKNFNKELMALTKGIKDLSIKEIAVSSPPAKCQKTQPILKTFSKIHPNLPTKVFPGATDLSFLSSIHIEGVIFGPGEVKAMHTSNEYVLLDNLDKCKQQLKRVIKGFTN